MHKINEGALNRHDVDDVLKRAAELRPEKKGFLGFGKKQGFALSDLQWAWADAGYPKESNKLYKLLRDQGYARKEVNKIFRDVFDTRYGRTDTENSPAVTKMANYIKKYGYTEDIVHFLETQYDFNDYEDAVTEQIRTVFERIIHEDRADLPMLQREFNQQNLGRQRK